MQTVIKIGQFVRCLNGHTHTHTTTHTHTHTHKIMILKTNFFLRKMVVYNELVAVISY